MPTITLLRHGQASFGAADYDALSDLGRQQSQIAGQVLAERGLRTPVWVHGSLRRQRDTAALAMETGGFDGTALIDPRFDEYDHIQLVRDRMPDGRPPTDSSTFQSILDDVLAEWITLDAADGWGAFAGDVRDGISELAASLPPGRDAVVATSGGVIATICAGLLGGGPETVVALNRIIVNASLTTLIVGRTGMSLLTFNDHVHFAGAHADLRTYR